MDPRLTLVTLGVRDLSASRHFYLDGLGWSAEMEVEGEVAFIQIGHGLLLALFDIEKLATEAHFEADGRAVAPIALAHNVDSESAVDAVMAAAEAAGATIVVPAKKRSWGGYSGYFADPDGFRWEIAYNPGLWMDAEGRPWFGTVDND